MNIPNELKYTKDHEWISFDGEIATVGITDFAQRLPDYYPNPNIEQLFYYS